MALTWMSKGNGGARPGLGAWILPILSAGLFLGLAAFCLLALAPHAGTHFLGAADSDVIRNSWGHWWVSQSILEQGRFPRYCGYLNFPMGMVILVIDLLGALLSVPLHLLLAPPAAYNAYLWLTLAFNGFATYLLARDRTESEGAGLVAGALFGLCPFVFSMALAGTSELVNVGWVSLYLLLALRMAEGRMGEGLGGWMGGSRARWLLPGLALSAVTLNCWYYGYIVGVASLILFPFALRAPGEGGWRPRALDILKHWGVFLVFTGLMVALFWEIVPTLRQSVGTPERLHEMAVADSVRLWELLEPENARWEKPSLFHLPWFTYPLGLVGIFVAGRRVRPFAIPLVLFLLLSGAYAQHSPLPGPPAARADGSVPTSILQSPALQNGAARGVARAWGGFTAPTYEAFQAIVPFSGLIRFPSRYLLIFTLSLSLFVAALLARLLALLGIRGAVSWLAGVPLALLLTLELAAVGRYHDATELTSAALPPYVEMLAADARPVGVLQLPVDLGGGHQIFFQQFHHKPMMAFINFVTSHMRMIGPPGEGGQRSPISYLQTVFAIHLMGYDRQARNWPRDRMPLPEDAQVREDVASLARAGFGYVIVEEALYRPEDLASIRAAIEPHLTGMDSGTEGILMYTIPSGEGAL